MAKIIEKVRKSLYLDLKLTKLLEKYEPKEAGRIVKELASYFYYLVFDQAEIFHLGAKQIVETIGKINIGDGTNAYPGDNQVFFNSKSVGDPDEIAAVAKFMADLKVGAFSVHAVNYAEVLKAAKENCSLYREPGEKTLVFAETALGSPEFDYVDGESPFKDRIKRFAQVAKNGGVDGLMVPAEFSHAFKERENTLKGMIKMATNVLLPWEEASEKTKKLGDIKRCLEAGANALLIGGDILFPPENIGTPTQAADKIYQIVADFHEKNSRDRI
jgi:orotidine-5'-phosphate decarboxylase